MNETDELRAALKWALPLVDLALESCRQERLRCGHADIGAGTNHIGLWPFEVTARDNARALVNGRPDEQAIRIQNDLPAA